MVVALAAGCFNEDDPATTPESSTTQASATGSATVQGTADAGSDATPDSGSAGGASDGNDCLPDEPDCECEPGDCADGLTCVMGECVATCGNGQIDGREECDGDVAGAMCLDCAIVCNLGREDCDADPSNGCEVDLASSDNCGTCGRDCLGGDCDGGACLPVDVVDGGAAGFDLAVYDGTLYWTVLETNGQILSHGVEPGGDASVVVDGAMNPFSLAVDGSHVYWSTGQTMGPEAGLHRVSLRDDVEQRDWSTAAEVTAAASMACSGGQLFTFRLGGGVFASDKSDASLVATQATSGARGVVTDDFVYWSDNVSGQIARVPLDDLQGIPEVVVGEQPGAWGVAVTDSTVFWTTTSGDGAEGTAKSRSLDDAGEAPLVYATGLFNPRSIVADDDQLFFAGASTGGQIWRAQPGEEGATPIAQDRAPALVADDVAVYWVAQGLGGTTTIRKLAK